MTAEPDHELLSRAARELREAPEPGWAETGERLVSAVRTAARRTVPLAADWHPDPALDTLPERSADRLTVSDQVVLSTLRRAVATVPGCRLTGVTLGIEAGSCIGARIRLTAGYGTELGSAGTEVRAVAQLVLQELLGGLATSYPVDVTFEDVNPPELMPGA